MGSTSRKGQAQINPSAPEALGICDRCGRLFNLRSLTYQYQWVGTALQNLHLKVCEQCLDVPQEQLRAIILPPDPLPVYDPRTEPYAIDQRNDYTISALFQGVADIRTEVTAELSPIVATFTATAAMSGALQVERLIVALLSGTASMEAMFDGQEFMVATITGTANVTAALEAGYVLNGVAISTTAAVSAALSRGHSVTATMSCTAQMSGALNLGMVQTPTFSSVASVVAELTHTVAGLQGRYVGAYEYTYPGDGSPAEFTIPAGDMTLPAGATKQLLIFAGSLEGEVSLCFVDFAPAPVISVQGSGAASAFGGAHTTSGDAEVAIVNSNETSVANEVALVYEFVQGEPLVRGTSFPQNLTTFAASSAMSRYTPVGGLAVAGGIIFPAGAANWTNLTERVEDPSGMTSADELTPAVSAVRNAVTMAAAGFGFSIPAACVGVAPAGFTPVKGSLINIREFPLDFEDVLFDSGYWLTSDGAGDHKLLVCITYADNATITDIEYDGVNMTLVGSVANTSGGDALRAYIYSIEIVDGVNSDGTVEITFSTTISATVYISHLRLYDVGSVGTPQTSTGSGTGLGVSLNVTSDACVIGLSVREDNGDPITWSGAQTGADTDATAYRASIGVQWQAAGSATYALNAVGSVSSRYATIGVPFQP
jgi:hypothetical protein